MKRCNFSALLVLVFILVTVVSCVPPSGAPIVIGFSPAAPTAPIAGVGDTIDVKVTSSGDWVIADSSILNVTPSVTVGGAGVTELQLIVDANPSLAHTRVISVRFSLSVADEKSGFIVWRAVQAASE